MNTIISKYIRGNPASASAVALLLALGLGDAAHAQAGGGILGFADIHNHQFADLAFGGRAIVGRPFGPIDAVLNKEICIINHGENHGLGDFMGGLLATRNVIPLIYSNEGYDELSPFEKWPAFWEVTHQKIYQSWLQRAVRGGLRLMVVFAVESPVLCNLTNHIFDCDDEMASIKRQIDEANAMQRDIDKQNGGIGNGWYRIVKTAAEARSVINEGKLAVVLGLETAHPFNCNGPDCGNWPADFQKFWDLGVRHFFPIHQDNNTFGGASYFNGIIQGKVNGSNPVWGIVQPYRLWVEPCTYEFNAVAPLTLELPFGGRCNIMGLTTEGKKLVLTLMDHGAMIDIDHMSDRSFSDTLDIAERYNYPVVASHAGFNKINNNDQDHEGQLTDNELARIQGVGGMVGLIVNQGGTSQVDTYRRGDQHYVPYNCGRSTEALAQPYYYALDHAPGMPIALGTDMNGPITQTAPRFGDDACQGDIRLGPGVIISGSLSYPFVPLAAPNELMYKAEERTPNRTKTWDFNTDGLAHIGLLPDLITELEQVHGIPAEALDPLLHSAEGYIKVWERAEKTARERHDAFQQALASSNDSPVAKCQDAIASADQNCHASTTIDKGSYDPAGTTVTLTQVPPGPYELGKTPVLLKAEDAEGDSAFCEANITVADNSPPAVICPADQVLECTGPQGVAFSFAATATDNCTAPVVATCTRVSGTIFPIGETSTNCSAVDEAGNQGVCSFSVRVVDTTAPQINSVIATPASLRHPNHKMVPVTIAVSATDLCSMTTTCKIISVSSNEPIDGTGDGDTAPDWQITGDLTLNLRAERSGNGNGRKYTIAAQCTDTSGNKSEPKSVIVTVPHDQGKK
jgi:microsomal dipeptidase-like Zn-dependent dipeptidase